MDFSIVVLDESICHFRGVGLFCRFHSVLMENPDIVHCLPMALLRVSR